MTGEQIETEIFIGTNYYMRLKHMVKDKINYRAEGPRTLLTKQTVQGRANDGGLRIGEMERDGLIAHGASKFIQESFMVRGDQYEMAVCNTSGCIAIYNIREDNFYSLHTDGNAMFWTDKVGNEDDCIVPSSSLGKLTGVMSGIVEVETSFQFVRFSKGKKVITSKLIDETFPDYKMISGCVKEYDDTFSLNCEDFKNSVKLVSDLGSKADKLVVLDIVGGDCSISSVDKDFGTEADVVIDCESSKYFRIGFNANFLMNILGKFSGIIDVKKCLQNCENEMQYVNDLY